jgi:Ser/Thr protein kinase RdoA (MazF antagonist)
LLAENGNIPDGIEFDAFNIHNMLEETTMKQIRVTRSFVAADALSEIINDEYDLDQVVTCKLFSKMLRTQDNDHYQVRVGDKKYVARVYQHGSHLGREEADYQFELDWLNFLKENDVPVSYPFRRKNGEFLGQLNAPEGIRYYALFSFADGQPMSPTNEEQLYVMGQEMARIHKVSNTFKSQYERQPMNLEFLIDRPLQQIQQFWTNKKDEKLEILLTSAKEAREELLAILDNPTITEDGWGPIGGDFHHVNTYFNGDQPTFFNFDLCGYGWRAYDIATFLLNTDLLHKSTKLSEAFFAGYYSVRPLSNNEHEAISPLLTLRRVWLTGTFSVVDGIVGHTFIAPL